MGHPLHIPHRTGGDGVDAVVVTPESAGWSYSGLRVVDLAPGCRRRLETGGDEVIVLPLAGSCTVDAGGEHFELAGRPDVWSRVSDFAYVGPGTALELASDGGARLALPSARAGAARPAAYGRAEDVPVEVRGAGSASRQLNNFAAPSAWDAEKLVAVECITPAGNWSSWPPHKHDTAGPGEAVLEEIYYFEVAAAGTPRRVGAGFALQRLYTPDGEIDLCEQVRHGDVVLIPRGYHGPAVTAPGYDLYYLNVLAGPAPERTMAFCDDPAHGWVRDGWPVEPADPRLPVSSAAGPVSPG